VEPGHRDAEDGRLAFEAPDERLRRREFIERLGMTVGAGAVLAGSLGPNTLIAEAARLQSRAAALPRPSNLPVDTFVVLMMENRSFDHFLGWLPKADGKQAVARLLAFPARPSGPVGCFKDA
jgi:phospholipase C